MQEENNRFEEDMFQKNKEIAILRKEIDHYEHSQDKADKRMLLQDERIQQLQKELDAYKHQVSSAGDSFTASVTKDAFLNQEETAHCHFNECKKSQKSLEELMRELEALKQSLEEKQFRIASLEQLNGELDDGLQMADSEIDRLQGCVNKKEGKIANLERWNKKMVEELQLTDGKVDKLKEEVQSLKQLNGELDHGIQMASKELNVMHHNNTELEDDLSRVTEEKEEFERRLDEAIDEQDMLDMWIRKLNAGKNEWKERCEKTEKVFAKAEDNLASMTDERDTKASLLANAEEELRLIKNARTRQYYHDLTIQIGLQHLKSDMEKKMQSCGAGVFKFRKTASKLNIINKLLVHVKSALNTKA